MPVHFGAMEAAAMGWVSAQDCEDNDVVDAEMEAHGQATTSTPDEQNTNLCGSELLNGSTNSGNVHHGSSSAMGAVAAGASEATLLGGRSTPANKRSQSVRFAEPPPPQQQQHPLDGGATSTHKNTSRSDCNIKTSSPSSSLLNPLSVRSITSERFNTTNHDRHRGIRLRVRYEIIRCFLKISKRFSAKRELR